MKTNSKKARRQKRSARGTGIIVTVITLTVFIYLLATFINLQTDIKEKKTKLSEISAQYERQLAENEELQKLIDEGDEARYIERIAREQRGYVYPDERVYYDITPGSN